MSGFKDSKSEDWLVLLFTIFNAGLNPNLKRQHCDNGALDH